MMWFEKEHPRVLYVDRRVVPAGSLEKSPNFSVRPDRVVDFRDMPFPDKSFKLVVWDPPHLRDVEGNSWVAAKYGVLDPETWRDDIRAGFRECWRVLEDDGVLIFKWSRSAGGRKSRDISTAEVLRVIHPIKPLFGHPSGSKLNTIWMTFMKFPEEKDES